MIPRTSFERHLDLLYPLLTPTAVFFVAGAALGFPAAVVQELASGIFTENLAPRSFWTTLSLTCFAFAMLLYLTRKISRTGPSWAWAALMGPRVQIQGWLVTIGGMSAGLGLLSILLAVFDRSLETGLVAVAALGFAYTTACILDWMGPLGAHFDADYDPRSVGQRKQRRWMIAGMVALGVVAVIAALSVDDVEPCSRACDASATEGVSPIPASRAESEPSTRG